MQVELKLRRLHPLQKIMAEDTTRYKVYACGRRFGKTEAGKDEAVNDLLNGRRVWWTNVTYANARETWEWFKYALRAIPGTHIREVERRLVLPTGGFLRAVSVDDFDNLRGEGLDRVYMDEAAFTSEDAWERVLRPMLLDRKGGAVFLSSPNGMNWFQRLYQRGLDSAEPDWQAYHHTCYDNPLIDRDELDAIRRTTPERIWREEYMAEFLSDQGAVFRGIREIATAPLRPARIYGHRYIFGVDWGKDNDFTAILVFDATVQQMVALERFNQIGWSLQRGRLRALYDTWQPELIIAESNSIGSPNIEALQIEGLPVQPFATTGSSKPPLIEGLALAIERKELAIQDEPVLINELASYTLERLPGGAYRYNAPSGMHDDTVIALALAWYGANNASQIRVVSSGSFGDYRG
jgi:hypothetical protein